MILYHAITIYHLLECMVHRQLFQSKEKSILILPDFIVDKFPDYLKLKENGLFEEVFLFSYMKIPHCENGLEQRLEEVYMEDVGIPLDEFDNIYVAGVHFYFSILLAEKKRYFTAFEEAAGGVFQCAKLERNISLKFPIHAQIAQKYKMLTYENPYIKELYVYEINESLQKSQKRFVLQKELKKLKRKNINQILCAFDEKRIILMKRIVIILTEQFYNLGYLTMEEQKELYRIVIRYVKSQIGKNIYIKPHPDDKIAYGEMEGIDGTVSSLIPAELIPYMFLGRKLQIVTISSTAVKGLKDKRTEVHLLKNDMTFKTMFPEIKEYAEIFS